MSNALYALGAYGFATECENEDNPNFDYKWNCAWCVY